MCARRLVMAPLGTPNRARSLRAVVSSEKEPSAALRPRPASAAPEKPLAEDPAAQAQAASAAVSDASRAPLTIVSKAGEDEVLFLFEGGVNRVKDEIAFAAMFDGAGGNGANSSSKTVSSLRAAQRAAQAVAPCAPSLQNRSMRMRSRHISGGASQCLFVQWRNLLCGDLARSLSPAGIC